MSKLATFGSLQDNDSGNDNKEATRNKVESKHHQNKSGELSQTQRDGGQANIRDWTRDYLTDANQIVLSLAQYSNVSLIKARGVASMPSFTH